MSAAAHHRIAALTHQHGMEEFSVFHQMNALLSMPYGDPIER